MKRSIRILFFIFLAVIASCIDPYTPNLKNYKSLLVVEGIISDENRSYEITLGRSFSHADSTPEKVSDAEVYVTDGEGTKYDFNNSGNGKYRSDSTLFRAVVDRTYNLHIHLADGRNYISDSCKMLPVAGIDSLYYEKGEEITGNTGLVYTGLKILLNSSEGTGSHQYYRWTYDEVWKFNVPYSPAYTFNYVNDTIIYFGPVPAVITACWKLNHSSDILISHSSVDNLNRISGEEVLFIPPELSNRLTIKYSILVRQYSISEKEYTFWEQMKAVGEPSGEIFGSQPYPIAGNVHNADDESDKVLGYFGVSAVKEQRLFITEKELRPLELPAFKNDCEYIRKCPDDYPPPPNRPTWAAIYNGYVTFAGYVFVTAEVNDGYPLPGNVNIKDMIKLVFTSRHCAYCEETGSVAKPDFWVDAD
jgi:hypothetical protein